MTEATETTVAETAAAAEAAKTFKRGDKRATAIALINANPLLNQTEISALIADELGITVGNATSYYRYCVTQGLTNLTEIVKGPSVTRGRKADPNKPAKVKAEKKVKAAKPKKTPEEIAGQKVVQAGNAMAALERARARAAAAKAKQEAAELAAVSEDNIPEVDEVEELTFA